MRVARDANGDRITQCTVAGCDRPHSCRGYCDGHYQRFRAGKPVDVPLQRKVRSDGSCSVEGCERKHWSGGLCDLHHQRAKAGLPMDFAGRIYGQELCSVEGCERANRGGGYCGAHWHRAKVGLPMDTPIRRVHRDAEHPGYGAAHDQIRRVRGLARQFTCPCGKPAAEWALDNDSPRVIVEIPERGLAGKRYSLDPMDYSPMCTACHQKMDHDWNASRQEHDHHERQPHEQ